MPQIAKHIPSICSILSTISSSSSTLYTCNWNPHSTCYIITISISRLHFCTFRSFGRSLPFRYASQIRLKLHTANTSRFHFLVCPPHSDLHRALSHSNSPWMKVSACNWRCQGRGLTRLIFVLVTFPWQSGHDEDVRYSSNKRTRNPSRYNWYRNPTPWVGAWNRAMVCACKEPLRATLHGNCII